MDSFICEIYDLPDLEGFNLEKIVDIKTATLHYNNIYNDPIVLKNMCFSWVWQKFFGILPSKIDVFIAKQQIATNEFQDIVNYIMASTFAKFAKNVYEPNLPMWMSEFSAYRSSFPSIAKSEIIKKLKDRFVMVDDLRDNMSLWVAFKHIMNIPATVYYQTEAEVVAKHDLLKTNPFTGCTLSRNAMQLSKPFKFLNRYDAIKAVLHRDHYFMRSCFVRCGAIIHECDQTDLSWFLHPLSTIVKGKVNVFTSHDEVLEKVSSIQTNTFVMKCPMGDEKMYSCIPSVFGKVIVYKPRHTLLHNRVWTLNPLDTYIVGSGAYCQVGMARYLELTPSVSDESVQLFQDCIIPDSTGFLSSNNFRKSLMELYLRTKNPYTNIRFGERNAPEAFVHVMDKLVRSCLKNNALPTSLPTSTAAKNCILVVDNRENPFTVLSTCITMMNLKPREWNVVVVSSTKSIGFYKDAFANSDIEYMTHPSLNKDLFDIEDYNTLMKLPFIWQALGQKYDYCLTIQDDGMLIRKGLEDKFLGQYDYVGAPWAQVPENIELATAANPHYVGNGGLSLRNVKMMHEITVKYSSNTGGVLFNYDLQPLPEDAFFSRMVFQTGGRIPNHQTAQQFAAEQVPIPTAGHCLGFHKPWVYLTVKDVLMIIQGM